MRAIAEAEGLSKAYRGQRVLEGASFRIGVGQKVGVVGPNGSGKTTLLRLLLGIEKPDSGTLRRDADLRIAYQRQRIDPGSQVTVAEVLLGGTEVIEQLEEEAEDLATQLADPDLDGVKAGDLARRLGELQRQLRPGGDAAGQAHLIRFLADLGLEPSVLDRPFNDLSGGERTRAVLAATLSRSGDADLIMLDEPTSHLDIEATEWLEDHLRGLRGTVVVVSHDRYFLDNVADLILELHAGTILTYAGDYSYYVRVRDQREEDARQAHRKEDKERARLQASITEMRRRNPYDAQVKSKERALAKRSAAPSAREKQRTLGMGARSDGVGGREVYTATDLGKSFGDRVLFTDLSFSIEKGDRLGIVGPNGIGKTTLLRILLGEEEASAGEVLRSKRLRIGYYDQAQGGLDDDLTIIEQLRQLLPGRDELEVRKLLAMFAFRGVESDKVIGTLSGGERGRLCLLRLVLQPNNLLVLDEPTNYLDIAACEAVESALRAYDGTLVVVSHDRYFLDAICTGILAMDEKGIRHWPGNYSEYRRNAGMANRQRAGREDRQKWRVKGRFREYTRGKTFKDGDVILASDEEIATIYKWAVERGKLVQAGGGPQESQQGQGKQGQGKKGQGKKVQGKKGKGKKGIRKR